MASFFTVKPTTIRRLYISALIRRILRQYGPRLGRLHDALLEAHGRDGSGDRGRENGIGVVKRGVVETQTTLNGKSPHERLLVSDNEMARDRPHGSEWPVDMAVFLRRLPCPSRACPARPPWRVRGRRRRRSGCPRGRSRCPSTRRVSFWAKTGKKDEER